MNYRKIQRVKNKIKSIVMATRYKKCDCENYRSDNEIDYKEARDMIQQKDGVLLIDVRSNAEYQEGHLSGAMNIPLEEIELRSRNINKDTDIILYCQTGVRSTRAYERLKGLGFSNVYTIKGGLNNI